MRTQITRGFTLPLELLAECCVGYCQMLEGILDILVCHGDVLQGVHESHSPGRYVHVIAPVISARNWMERPDLER